MEFLIRALIAVFLVVFGLATHSTGTPSQTPTDTGERHVQTVIQSVTAQVLATTPAQIELTVTGYQPDGCDFPVQVDQARDGSQISVAIYRVMPADVMCPAILRSYNETIHLSGTYPPGTYHITVNDYSLEVTVK